MRWYPLSNRLENWLDASNRAKSEWHDWFAWYPVKASRVVGNHTEVVAIWLEHVQRQRVVTSKHVFWYYRRTRHEQQF